MSLLLKHLMCFTELSSEVILSQCVLFFLVGYDTTSSCLSFAAYNLAMNPQFQDMLAKEIDDKIQPGTKLTYDVVNDMPFLDAVISETLRLYPPVVILERTAREDIFVREFPVKKGTTITIPIYSLHRDPNLFRDPDKFDPSRFHQSTTRVWDS
ncbi:cytochrome P450 3A24-like [Limulus polyphemus]|uniref:Cytochrome P450 3A24-like n=1 Tax=Limulus polyphemus TaxID=6850 RepID=A0ABM1C1S7_LIMPO|nr:cytochrome P450 3A24-like [Limulus polyphemus]